MGKNYDWFMAANLDKEAGKWVVIVDQKIVASGTNVKGLLAEAKRKHPGKEAVLAKVPSKETLIL